MQVRSTGKEMQECWNPRAGGEDARDVLVTMQGNANKTPEPLQDAGSEALI